MFQEILGNLTVNLIGDVSGINKSLNDTKATMQQVGGSFRSVGAGLTGGITTPIIAAGAATFGFANEFNSGMANVASLGQEARDSIAGWGPEVETLAIDMAKNTGEMTAGLYDVVSAFGANSETMLNMAEQSKIAVAGNGKLASAVAFTSAVTKGWGDTSIDAIKKAGDLGLQTVALGQTTFPELAASIGRVTGSSKLLNVSQEELFATMATATGVTGGAAEVSTQLAAVYAALQNPSKELQGVFSDLGVSTGAAAIEQLGLAGTLDMIRSAATDTETPLAKYLGSAEAMNLANALGGPLAGEYARKLEEMGSAAGATDAAFKAQTEGVNAAGFEWQKFKVEMQVIAQQVGQEVIPIFREIAPVLRDGLTTVKGWISAYREMNPETQRAVLLIGGIAVAAGPVLVVIGSLISAVGAIVGAFGALSAGAVAVSAAFGGAATVAGGLSAVLALIGGPITLVIAAVGLLAVAWARDWGGIQTKTIAAIESIRNSIQPFIDYFVGIWESSRGRIVLATSLLWAGVQTIFGGAFDAIKLIFSVFTGDFTGSWSDLGVQLRVIFDEMVGGFVLSIAGLWGMVSPFLSQFWEDTKAWFAGINWGQLGANIIKGLAGGLTAEIPSLMDVVTNVSSAVSDVFTGFFGINSPSTLMRQYGAWMIEGLGLGQEDEKQGLESKAAGVVSGLPGIIQRPLQAAAGQAIPLPNQSAAGIPAGSGATASKSGDIILNFPNLQSIYGVEDFSAMVTQAVKTALDEDQSSGRTKTRAISMGIA